MSRREHFPTTAPLLNRNIEVVDQVSARPGVLLLVVTTTDNKPERRG
jgi:hypothetical protein